MWDPAKNSKTFCTIKTALFLLQPVAVQDTKFHTLRYLSLARLASGSQPAGVAIANR